MKQTLKRSLALLLCAALLMAAVPAAAAIKTTDFGAILEAGEKSVNSIYVVTDPLYYTADALSFNGDYSIYRDVLTGEKGIMDWHCSIVYPANESTPTPIKVLCKNVFLGNSYVDLFDSNPSGYLYDFQGNRIDTNSEKISKNSCGSVCDEITGACCGGYVGYQYIGEDGDRVALYRRLVKPDGTDIAFSFLFSAPWNGKCLTYQESRKQWGLMELNGQELLPQTYDYLRFLSEDRLLAKQNGQWSILTPEGSLVEALPYDSIKRSVSDDTVCFLVTRDGKYGVLDEACQLLIPVEYDSLERYDNYPFRFSTIIDGVRYHISEDPDVTLCGSRNFPEGTNILWPDRYLVPDGDAAYLTDGQGERLLPDRFWINSAQQSGGFLALMLRDTNHERIYDRELNLLMEISSGYYYLTDTRVVVLRTDDDLQPITEFYDQNGTLVQSLPGVRTGYITQFGLVLKKNDLFAFADQSGDPLTDYIYSFVWEVSGGREDIHYPYVIAERADTGSKELIDLRTGKNAITENAAVSDYEEIIGEGNYFPFYVDGKTGVARLTARDESPFRDVGNSTWFTEAVKFCYNAGLISGMGGGDFGPRVTMNRAMLVTVLYRISGEKTASHGFADVPEGKYYTDAVNWAASLGIVKGKTETTFCPKDPVTREQLVAILYNYACLFGEQEADPSVLDSFEDAGRVGNYAKTPMAWAVGVGLVKGRTSTTLDPKGNATRAEIAVILMRFIRYMAA